MTTREVPLTFDYGTERIGKCLYDDETGTVTMTVTDPDVQRLLAATSEERFTVGMSILRPLLPEPRRRPEFPRVRLPAAPTAEEWNAKYPISTPVRYWPGIREGEGTESVTRTEAWTLGSGAAVVAVEGYAGGIALTHVEPVTPR